MNKIMIKGDPELKEIIPGFIEKRINEILTMKEALSRQDFQTLQTLGHRLKGNAGGYGFDYMGTIGAAIEEAAKVSDSKKIEPLILELEDYLSRIEVVYQ